MITAAASADVTSLLAAERQGTTRPTSLRSAQMQQLLHEDLARAHLDQRLADAAQQRLAHYVVRLARARRAQKRARRHAEQVQLRLRLLAG
ncbi:hypothetical protein GCM10027446_18770 [Angustibacter peucedani]